MLTLLLVLGTVTCSPVPSDFPTVPDGTHIEVTHEVHHVTYEISEEVNEGTASSHIPSDVPPEEDPPIPTVTTPHTVPDQQIIQDVNKEHDISEQSSSTVQDHEGETIQESTEHVATLEQAKSEEKIPEIKVEENDKALTEFEVAEVESNSEKDEYQETVDELIPENKFIESEIVEIESDSKNDEHQETVNEFLPENKFTESEVAEIESDSEKDEHQETVDESIPENVQLAPESHIFDSSIDTSISQHEHTDRQEDQADASQIFLSSELVASANPIEVLDQAPDASEQESIFIPLPEESIDTSKSVESIDTSKSEETIAASKSEETLNTSESEETVHNAILEPTLDSSILEETIDAHNEEDSSKQEITQDTSIVEATVDASEPEESENIPIQEESENIPIQEESEDASIIGETVNTSELEEQIHISEEEEEVQQVNPNADTQAELTGTSEPLAHSDETVELIESEPKSESTGVSEENEQTFDAKQVNTAVRDEISHISEEEIIEIPVQVSYEQDDSMFLKTVKRIDEDVLPVHEEFTPEPESESSEIVDSIEKPDDFPETTRESRVYIEDNEEEENVQSESNEENLVPEQEEKQIKSDQTPSNSGLESMSMTSPTPESLPEEVPNVDTMEKEAPPADVQDEETASVVPNMDSQEENSTLITNIHEEPDVVPEVVINPPSSSVAPLPNDEFTDDYIDPLLHDNLPDFDVTHEELPSNDYPLPKDVQLIPKNTHDHTGEIDEEESRDLAAGDHMLEVEAGTPRVLPPQQEQVSAAAPSALTPGCIVAIVFGVLVSLVVLLGVGGFMIWTRRNQNRPKVLGNDQGYAGSDSGGYIDDQVRVSYVNSQTDTPKESPEDLISLDNDSFLNSLESMTIQNLWTDNIRHTKL